MPNPAPSVLFHVKHTAERIEDALEGREDALKERMRRQETAKMTVFHVKHMGISGVQGAE